MNIRRVAGPGSHRGDSLPLERGLSSAAPEIRRSPVRRHRSRPRSICPQRCSGCAPFQADSTAMPPALTRAAILSHRGEVPAGATCPRRRRRCSADRPPVRRHARPAPRMPAVSDALTELGSAGAGKVNGMPTDRAGAASASGPSGASSAPDFSRFGIFVRSGTAIALGATDSRIRRLGRSDGSSARDTRSAR